MKKIFLTLTTVLFSLQGFAGSVKAYSAVLELDSVKALTVIEKIEVKSALRCQECYEMSVRGLKNPTDTQCIEFLVSTRLDSATNKVVAKLIEQ